LIEEQIEIDGVLYHHGETANGVNGFRNDAKQRMQCTVSGHNHSNLGVSYTASDRELVWGMAVGCGVNQKHLAFAYGRHFKLKPIIGCGVVIDGVRLTLSRWTLALRFGECDVPLQDDPLIEACAEVL
jgi:hypothetical protein